MSDFTDFEIYSMCLGKFEIIEELGKGSIGIVLLAEYKPTGKLYALKIIPEYRAEVPIRGISIAANMNHPNLLKCHGYFMCIYNDESCYVCIMEFVQGQDLFELFLSDDAPRPFHTLPDIIRQIAEGLNYIHERGYVHRDIKVENILVSIHGCVKIIDWDFLSRACITEDINGTPCYISPEIIHFSLIKGSNDMWALGVTLYVIFTNDYPFYSNDTSGESDLDSEDLRVLFYEITDEHIDFKRVPNKYQSLVRGLLRKDYRIRLTASQVISTINSWYANHQSVRSIRSKKSKSQKNVQKYDKCKIG